MRLSTAYEPIEPTQSTAYFTLATFAYCPTEATLASCFDASVYDATVTLAYGA